MIPPLIKMTAVPLSWSGVSKFAMLLFNLNNPAAYSALGDPTNSHSGCWGVQQWVTPSWLWKYITHNPCHVVYESACIRVCVRTLGCNHLSRDSYYNTEWAVCWRRGEGKGGILFCGLLVWHLETSGILWRRREGNVLSRREIKRGERAFSPSHWVGWSLERNLPILINEKMEKRFPFFPLLLPLPVLIVSLPQHPFPSAPKIHLCNKCREWLWNR